MLKARYLFVSLALLVALTSDSLGRPRHQPPVSQAPKTEQSAAPDQRGSPNDPITVNVVPTAEQKATAEKDAANARLKATQDQKLVDYTGDLVIVGIVTFGIFVLQLIAFSVQACYMRISAKEMRRTTYAAIRSARASQKAANHIPRVERAYLFLALTLKHELREHTLTTAGTRSTIKFNFYNHGRTPAIINELHGMAKYWPGQQWPAMTDAGRLAVQTGVVVSGNSTISEDDYAIQFPLTKQERELAAAGEGRILFWGKIVYSDVFGNSRETGWCRQFYEDKEARDGGGIGFYFAGDETLNYYT